MNGAVARAFDAAAPAYDEHFTETSIGRAQRWAVWQLADRLFLPGDRILEINCGTGVDAVHLAERGIHVHACDASAAMVERARARVNRATALVTVEQRAIEDLSGIAGTYDGVFSNFGGLNCLEDIGGAIAQLSRLVRVGGNVVLCYMGPFCVWEIAWYLAHGQPDKAFRRWRASGVNVQLGYGHHFRVRYPSYRTLARALGASFRLVERRGVGIFIPPSYVERTAIRHARAFGWANRLDRAVRAWPVFRSAADHLLLHFQKVSA